MTASTAGLEASLDRINAGLIKLGRDVTLDLLRPGMSAKQLRTLMTPMGAFPVEDMDVIYAWHDGTDAERGERIGDLVLFPGFYLLSIEDAMLNYAAFQSDPRWSPSWFPVFADGGGDFYVVDLGSHDTGAIRHFRIEESDHPIEFGSLAAMMKTVAEAFADGTIFVDAEGYLEMDDGMFATLAARMNPNIRWWRD